MNLYYDFLRSEDGLITYFHIFSGEYYDGYVTIDKSYFEFCGPLVNIVKPGRQIYTGSSITENIKYTRRDIIHYLLNGDFDFKNGRKIRKNEL